MIQVRVAINVEVILHVDIALRESEGVGIKPHFCVFIAHLNTSCVVYSHDQIIPSVDVNGFRIICINVHRIIRSISIEDANECSLFVVRARNSKGDGLLGLCSHSHTIKEEMLIDRGAIQSSCAVNVQRAVDIRVTRHIQCAVNIGVIQFRVTVDIQRAVDVRVTRYIQRAVNIGVIQVRVAINVEVMMNEDIALRESEAVGIKPHFCVFIAHLNTSCVVYSHDQIIPSVDVNGFRIICINVHRIIRSISIEDANECSLFVVRARNSKGDGLLGLCSHSHTIKEEMLIDRGAIQSSCAVNVQRAVDIRVTRHIQCAVNIGVIQFRVTVDIQRAVDVRVTRYIQRAVNIGVVQI